MVEQRRVCGLGVGPQAGSGDNRLGGLVAIPVPRFRPSRPGRAAGGAAGKSMAALHREAHRRRPAAGLVTGGFVGFVAAVFVAVHSSGRCNPRSQAHAWTLAESSLRSSPVRPFVRIRPLFDRRDVAGHAEPDVRPARPDRRDFAPTNRSRRTPRQPPRG
ncbi:MAG: hypothetical protein JO252_19330, partial [Planctomycetaceae bacterium]|nr:hypothetical protein [Planctomycetaceae bacterium]